MLQKRNANDLDTVNANAKRAKPNHDSKKDAKEEVIDLDSGHDADADEDFSPKQQSNSEAPKFDQSTQAKASSSHGS